tara:strand:- start:2637 stop:3020 length:384 start_codon:yes stop_codon:yes gene_type:complete
MKLFDDFQSGTFKREGYDGNISVTLSDDGRYISIHSLGNTTSRIKNITLHQSPITAKVGVDIMWGEFIYTYSTDEDISFGDLVAMFIVTGFSFGKLGNFVKKNFQLDSKWDVQTRTHVIWRGEKVEA